MEYGRETKEMARSSERQLGGFDSGHHSGLEGDSRALGYGGSGGNLHEPSSQGGYHG